jgi:hypothetical protein
MDFEKKTNLCTTDLFSNKAKKEDVVSTFNQPNTAKSPAL